MKICYGGSSGKESFQYTDSASTPLLLIMSTIYSSP